MPELLSNEAKLYYDVRGEGFPIIYHSLFIYTYQSSSFIIPIAHMKRAIE
jgi:hypothetical protein